MEVDTITKNVIDFIITQERKKKNNKNEDIDMESDSDTPKNGINALFNRNPSNRSYSNVFSSPSYSRSSNH